MLAAERQAKIVEIIRRQGSAQVEDLAQNLQVSTMTIRRDLEKSAGGRFTGAVPRRCGGKAGGSLCR